MEKLVVFLLVTCLCVCGVVSAEEPTAEYTPFAHHAEYLFTYRADIDYTTQRSIETVNGTRTISYLTGGKVWGPKLNGTILPGGGDWYINRSDNYSITDVRLTMQTDSGSLIYMNYTGAYDIQNYIDGLTFQGYSTPKFETDDPDYAWLTRLICYGVGVPGDGYVQYDVYGLYPD